MGQIMAEPGICHLDFGLGLSLAPSPLPSLEPISILRKFLFPIAKNMQGILIPHPVEAPSCSPPLHIPLPASTCPLLPNQKHMFHLTFVVCDSPNGGFPKGLRAPAAPEFCVWGPCWAQASKLGGQPRGRPESPPTWKDRRSHEAEEGEHHALSIPNRGACITAQEL